MVREAKEATYKSLFGRFVWQGVLLIITLTVGASIILVTESKGGTKIDNNNHTKEEILRRFSSKHNVSTEVLENLISNITKLNDGKQYPMTHLQAVMLVLSLFFTIGWGHIVPITAWGKILSVFLSLIGIPLTLIFIYSGSKLVLRLIKDILQIILSYNYNHNKLTKYCETKIKVSTKKNMLPTMVIIFVLYFFLSALIVAKIEKFSYPDALWYTFITFTTIGLDDFTKSRMFYVNGGIYKEIGQAFFMILWLLIGFTILGANWLIFFALTDTIHLREIRLINNKQDDTLLITSQEETFDEQGLEEEREHLNKSGKKKHKARWHPFFK